MNYKQALKLGGVTLAKSCARGGPADEAWAAMRAHGLFRGKSKAPLARKMALAGVKPRVAKRWATRLLREGMPRRYRIAGPALAMWRAQRLVAFKSA